MKILHVNNVANVPDGLVKGLKELDVDAQLYQPYVGINKKKMFGPIGVIANRISDARILKAKIKKEKFDIVHIHYAYFGMLGFLGGYEYWLHCHGTDIRRNLYHPLYKVPTIISMKNAKSVLYSTPDLKVHAENKRPDASFLPNPIQTSKFEPTDIPESVHGKVLLISRIDAIKGIDAAFDAIKIIKKKNPSISIDAFLWGPDLERFKDNRLVNWIPTVSYNEIAKLLHNYQVIIGQFELGILGMSEMEAMACARPVVCDFTHYESYHNPPPIVQAKTSDEISQKVLALAESPSECGLIGRKSREWVVENHDYIKVAKRLVEKYESK
jgi:glycosyltransferase involved in cell wall biosynthesis